MVKKITVEGYNAVKKAIDETEGTVYIQFSGSLDENGMNWCPDCVTADPVIEKNLEKLGDDVTFILCHVGPRPYWKDVNNEFRKDPQLLLKCVPTLLKKGTPQRLEEGQCANDELVAMMFEEED